MENWKHDKTWLLIEQVLLEKQKACLGYLASSKTTWEETLEYRGRYAQITELLKLPEQLDRATAAKLRGHDAR